MNGTDKLCVSFSGGETSAYMTWRLFEEFRDTSDIDVVFANTGQEHEETLKFVQRCSDAWGWGVTWIEAVISPENGVGPGFKIVDFDSAARKGEPFESAIKKYGIPNVSYPHCSERLKQMPMAAYRKAHGLNQTPVAVGIRADEWDRINPERAKLHNLVYPLVIWGTQKADVNRFWANQHFRLNLKGYEGNCKTCWKKTDRKLGTIAKDHPEWFDFFREMERKYSGFCPETQNRQLPAYFFRGNRSVEDILKIPDLPGFVPATDDKRNTIAYEQGDLFVYSEDALNLGCRESCEAY